MPKVIEEEHTIQNEELEEELDLEEIFEDEDDLDELDDEEIEDEAEENGPDPAEDPKPTAGGIRIKYNGEEIDLTQEEAIEFAQKGKNYDKVKAENDSWNRRGGPKAIELIENLADENGMSVDEYIEFASNNLSKSSVNAQIRQLQKEHPDWPEEVVKELAESRAEKKIAQAKAEKEAKEQAPWDELLAEYPDMKADSMPAEVHEMIQNGKSPLMAMRTYENAQLKKELEELKKNAETKEKNANNRRSTVGSVKGSEKPKIDDIDAILLAED